MAAAAGLILEQGVAGTTLEEVRAAAGVQQLADLPLLRRQGGAGPRRSRLPLPDRGRRDPRAGAGRDRGHRRPAGLAGHDRLPPARRGLPGRLPARSLGSELAELDHVARHDVAAGFSRWEAAIRACLQGMRDRGQLVPAADPGQLATAMLAALDAGLLLAQIERNTRPLAAALDVMITLTELLASSAARRSCRAKAANARPGPVCRARTRTPSLSWCLRAPQAALRYSLIKPWTTCLRLIRAVTSTG